MPLKHTITPDLCGNSARFQLPRPVICAIHTLKDSLT